MQKFDPYAEEVVRVVWLNLNGTPVEFDGPYPSLRTAKTVATQKMNKILRGERVFGSYNSNNMDVTSYIFESSALDWQKLSV